MGEIYVHVHVHAADGTVKIARINQNTEHAILKMLLWRTGTSIKILLCSSIIHMHVYVWFHHCRTKFTVVAKWTLTIFFKAHEKPMYRMWLSQMWIQQKQYTDETGRAPIQVDRQAVLERWWKDPARRVLIHFKAQRVCSSALQSFWFDFFTPLQAAKIV